MLDINGLLNGKRLRRCSAWARWRFPYYLLLANGYARIELDCDAIADKFVSFRNTAPEPELIRSEFEEYEKNHLVFIYQQNGKTWAQFDTPNTGIKEWKSTADVKSPAPPEEKYSEWLKEQHGEEWEKFHWFNPSHRTNGKRPEPEWFLTKKSSVLTKHTQESGQTHGLGVGVGVVVGIENLTPPTPLRGEIGPAAADIDSKDITPAESGQALCSLLGISGLSRKVVARDACAAVKRRKPDMRFIEIPEFIKNLWREYDSLPQRGKLSLAGFLGEIGRFVESDSWKKTVDARASPQVDDQGGHYECNGPQKVYVTAEGRRLPGYTPPPKPKGVKA